MNLAIARQLFGWLMLASLVTTVSPSILRAAELIVLSSDNWNQSAPHGKEVDCIYGDMVLRNDQLVTVIAKPVAGRNANMTVKNVGGAIIDLTRREQLNDQLSAYYPCGSRYSFIDPATLKVIVDHKPDELDKTGRLSGKTISLELTSVKDPKAKEPALRVTLRYTLADGEPFLRVETFHSNDTSKPVVETLSDSIRADKVFRFGTDDGLFDFYWASDEWFGQSYGVVCEGRQVRIAGQNNTQLELVKDGDTKVAIPPGEHIGVSRKIFPGTDIFQVRAIAQELASVPSRAVEISVSDPNGPVAHALVAIDNAAALPKTAEKADKAAETDSKAATATATAPPPIEKTYPKVSYGLARTDSEGRVRAKLPFGSWRVIVRAIGRPEMANSVQSQPSQSTGTGEPARAATPAISAAVKLAAPGYVAARVTDDRDMPIPAKVSFVGKDDTPDPFFGPDTGEVAVHNVYYTHNGVFRQEIEPGHYGVIVSYGPEYDAVFTDIEVKRGEETPLAARLVRSVDTRGWVSTDYHSHSTPSGDNVSSQTGRVLNLLCEHIEFAPCTEHNRIDTYVPILKRLGVERLMATCSGMELTGAPLPVNHQNAFPLVRNPNTQNNGGPEPHLNPIVQIERLAMWDDKSDKLVQGNHPNLSQILGDRDLNGEADEGFRAMLGFMDVVEIHPPEAIFTPPTKLDTGKGPRNPIFHWMQMLNLGYRIPGVVNTDAHYNFHGSGGLRNYVRSSTDDPAAIDTMEMVHQSEAGHIVVSNGPFLEVSARAAASTAGDKVGTAIPGDDLAAPGGKVSLSIRVQCPNWFDINRVQVFLNGRPETKLNFTRREHPEHFGKEAVRFEATIPLALREDTHVIVAAAGEDLKLGPVLGPAWGKQTPIAVSNPIFVDVDGGGFRPNGDRLGLELPLEASFRHRHAEQGR